MYLDVDCRLPDNMPVRVIGHRYNFAVYFTEKFGDRGLYRFPRDLTGAEYEALEECLELAAENVRYR